SPSQGTYNAATGLWDVGTLTSGEQETLQLQARVVSPATQINTASISHSDQFDPDAGNNTASAPETPQQADLQVGKSVSNPTPNVGDTITYTVTLTNNGPDDATGVTVQDVLSTRVSFRSSRLTRGSYDPASGIWTVGDLAAGATETLTIIVLVTSPNPQANTATVSHSDQFDPNTANNSATPS